MDGFRSLVYVDAGKCRLVPRNGNEFKSFSTLNAALAGELRRHSAVFDGEVVSLDDDGRPQFYDSLFRRGEPRLCAFDLLEASRTPPVLRRKCESPEGGVNLRPSVRRAFGTLYMLRPHADADRVAQHALKSRNSDRHPQGQGAFNGPGF